jgi:uncharacterized protein YndB with AHSA1/START domain
MTTACAHFQITRTFPLPPDRLWHLLTDARARELWGAPSDDHVLHVDATDLRVDGQDLHRCGPKDAPDYTVATRWYRLDGPEAACFTETVEAGGARIATSLVSYGLAAEGKGTRLTVEVATSSFVGPEALDDFEAGWTSGLNRLDRLVTDGVFA